MVTSIGSRRRRAAQSDLTEAAKETIRSEPQRVRCTARRSRQFDEGVKQATRVTRRSVLQCIAAALCPAVESVWPTPMLNSDQQLYGYTAGASGCAAMSVFHPWQTLH